MLQAVLFLLDSFATTAIFFFFWLNIEEKEEPLEYCFLPKLLDYFAICKGTLQTYVNKKE